jgi:hypothetical protein
MSPILLFISLAAVGPRNQLCLSGALAGTFLVQTRHLISSPDSFPVSIRKDHRLRTVPFAHVHLVTDERVCAEASAAYARDAGPGADKEPPFPVAVAIADQYFIVELGETAGRDAPYWETVVYDHKWRRLASFGGGA